MPVVPVSRRDRGKPMNLVPTAADQVFILRFWREATGCDDEFRWRAQIRNVNTRQRRVVDDIETALSLVLAQLCAAGTAAEIEP
jgi:hypothetical protein